MTSPMKLDGISLYRAGRAILDDVSLSLRRGETLALIGPSGSGKSTLVRIVLGLMAPDLGTVSLRGRVVTQAGRVLVPPEDRELAVVFQDLALWPHLTVAGNLRFVLRCRRLPRAAQGPRIASVLDRVGLAGMDHRYPGELSGGEQQRVAIARALVLEPDVVLFDEPMSNLDLILKRDLLALVAELLESMETSVLWVTHDPREVVAMGQRIAVLEAGRLVALGTRQELGAAPATDFVAAVVDDLHRR